MIKQILLLIFIGIIGLVTGVKKNNKIRKNKNKINKTSFLQTNDNDNVNAAFDDDFAGEDKFDDGVKRKRPYKDYNQEVRTSSKDLMKRVMDDLKGEEVNYKFD